MKLLIITKGQEDIELDIATRELSPVTPEGGRTTLERFQGYVGGWVECVGLGAMVGDASLDDVDLVLNEEGKLQGLDPSLLLLGPDKEVVDVIAGNAILCSADGQGNWVGLDESRVEELLRLLRFGLTNHGAVGVFGAA